MLGADRRVSIRRLTTDSYGQKTYGDPHRTGVEAYIEPASDNLALAQGAPVGQLWSAFLDWMAVPATVQISDLLTDEASSEKFTVTAIRPYEDHLEVACTIYESPTF